MRRLWRKLGWRLSRRRREQELDEEIEFHLEMAAREAGQAARKRFGNVELVREAARETWGWPALEGWLGDLRHAARSLRRAPVATVAAMISLALGVGASSAIFSIADALLLRPLAVPNPAALVSLYQRADEGRGSFSPYSYPAYEHLRERSRAFTSLLAFARLPLNARWGDEVERVSSEMVSENYFSTLGLSPALGRGFAAGDQNVAVLSERLWRERFAGRSDVLGQQVTLDGRRFTVIGVVAAGFQSIVLDWGNPPELWIPLGAHEVIPDLPMRNPGSHWLLVAGRLRDGVSLGQAQAEVRALLAGFYSELPAARGPRFAAVALPTREARFWPSYRASVLQYVGLLGAVAGLTLLMTGFNVASLLLGRASRRAREFGIQIAIGAGRGHLVRSLLLEVLLLALLGAAVGMALSGLTSTVLSRFHNPFGLPLHLDLSVHPRVLGFAMAMALLVTVLAGLAPLRLAWRLDVSSLLKGQGGAARGGRFHLADALVAAQFAICLVALSGGLLFVRTIERAQDSDPFFRAGDALLVDIDLLSAGYDEPRGRLFYRNLMERVRELPGVAGAALVKTVPLGGFRGAMDVRIGDVEANVQVNTISDGYFEAARLPIVSGRDLAPSESTAVLVNEPLATQFWPGRSALGQTVVWPRQARRFSVVGVVRDGRMRNFREARLQPGLYLPLEADYQRSIALMVRTSGRPQAAVGAVRGVVRELDRSLPFRSSTLEEHLDTALGKERLAATLLSGLGVLTCLLAAVGLYGLVSLAVSQRTRELAIRLALGSSRRRAVSTVLGRFAISLAAGAGLGAGATLLLGQAVRSLLFGVPPSDPPALATAALTLVVVAALAAAAPALRAARLDPIATLRQG